MFVIGLANQQMYEITMLTGSVLALGLGWYRCAKAGLNPQKMLQATALVPLLAAFFSHLLHGLVDVEYTIYTHSVGYLFAFWENGYMVYGGMLGAALGLWAIGGKDRLALLEQYAPGGALMLAAVRIGEGFLGQGYGEYWFEESFFCRFPFMVYDPDYEAWAWALFVLEALLALALLVILLKKKKPWQGDSALLGLGLYASAQILLESLRRDEFLRWGFVRVEEVFSAVLVLAVLLCYAFRAGKGKLPAKLLCFGAYAGLIVFCLLLEFSTEGRIAFLSFLDVDACYAAMAGACALLCGCVLWMRHLCNAPYIANQRKEC